MLSEQTSANQLPPTQDMVMLKSSKLTNCSKFYGVRFRAWVREWQEVLFWIPVSFFVAWFAYRAIPYIDPRAGIDGFGTLFNFAVNVLQLVVTFFLTWMFKRTYWFDIPTHEEVRLYEELTKSYDWKIHAIIIRDRIEWLVLLGLFSWLLFR